MVFKVVPDPNVTADVASLVAEFRAHHQPGVPELFRKAWLDTTETVFHDNLPQLGKRKKVEKPPCHVLGGICICGENAVGD